MPLGVVLLKPVWYQATLCKVQIGLESEDQVEVPFKGKSNDQRWINNPLGCLIAGYHLGIRLSLFGEYSPN